jgi:hypothetical protein
MAWLAILPGIFFGMGPARSEIPWKNGEELTYEVHWGLFIAAEAVFTAKENGPAWVMRLDLKSRGVVDTFNPIQSRFTSKMQTEPWRSLQFEEDRSEADERKKNRTVVLGESLKGRYEDLLEKKVTEFSLPQARMDDLGSLLYAMRVQDWRREKIRLFTVYDGPKIKYGGARLVRETTEAVGEWPRQKLLLIEAWPEDEKGKRKKGSLKLWITDDERRLPLRADFVARFGTFEIDLVKVGTTDGSAE